LQGTGEVEARIIQRALDYGASLAGICSAEALAESRSYSGGEQIQCAVKGHSLLVLALAQGDAWPEFDWFDSRPGSTPGNRCLFEIMGQMVKWLEEEEKIRSRALPYNLKNGGIFLKVAAMFAGLGTIGKNNLLITRDFGPRVRLRAIHLGRELAPTGPREYNFCEACDAPCRRACPQDAFDEGVFSRKRCSIQMRIDRFESTQSAVKGGGDGMETPVKFCRACELACTLANP
jgi:epoxyqueuosine reductase